MSTQTIPVTVVGGYLGAGKTTLVNHVLRSSDERIAVIVNDFGEISIDEDLIVAADSDKLTLANGCICCTLADGFAAALMQIRSAGTLPQRLLIEASGVADPAQIAAYGHTPGLRLDAVVVLADAEQIRRQADDRWVADTVRRQLATADLLVLNKIDLLRDNGPAGADNSTALGDWLRRMAPQAAMIGARRAAVPLDVLFGTSHPAAAEDPLPGDGTNDALAGRAHMPPDAAEQLRPDPGPDALPNALELFDSQTVDLEAPLAEEVVNALLAELPESVVRLKGLVQVIPGANSGGDRPGAPSDFLIEAVGARTSMALRQPDTIASRARQAISIITHKGALPPNWLRDRLRTVSRRQSGCE